MEPIALLTVGLVAATALAFDFTNGFHDTANAMATSIATGALKPKTAVTLAGILNLVGALLSTEVAQTISGGLINEDTVSISPAFVLAGLAGAIIWNLLTWLIGLPASSSHALLGGLVGAVLVGAGVQGVNLSAVIDKVLVPSLVSPVVAGTAAMVAVKLIDRITARIPKGRVDEGFKHGQTVTACLVALSHGSNDAQKTMGVITLALVAAGIQPEGSAPQLWVVLACASAISLGTYTGGWRVIKTVGKDLTEISTPQGFAAEVSSACSILLSSHMGYPLSTTQVCSGAIIGSGLGRSGQSVNWRVAGRMLVAWLITFPMAGLMSAGACLVVQLGVGGVIAVPVVLLVATCVIRAVANRNPVHAENVGTGDQPNDAR